MRTFLLAVLIMALPFSAHAGEGANNGAAKPSVLDIQRVVSKSGVEAWLVEDHSIPVIAMQFAFKGAGAVNNSPEQQGLARMLSNTMDEGAGDITSQDFQKELADLSISLSFHAGRDNFGGSVKTLTKNSARAFELLELALTEPRFDDAPVERMRKANQSRVRTSLSNPDWIAARLLNDVAYAGHPYALNSGGSLSSLAAITPADLRAYHKAVIGRNNLVVAVAGDITAKDLKALLDDVFGGLPQVDIADADALELQNQGGVFVYEKDIPQTIVEITQPGIDRKDADYQTAQVMNFVLGSSGFGSRLTEEIREKRGLTYGIYSSLQDLEAVDVLSVSTSTKNENVGEMLGLIRAEFERMRDTPISDEELADAKAYLIGSLPLSLTSTDAIAGLLASLQVSGLPIDYLDQREDAIMASSAEDVQALAARLLDPDAFLTMLVGMPSGDSFDDVAVTKTLTEIPNAE